ncbi:Elongation factor P--(R)-beta-lysine ligase [BD1-7 clade bacterium]|uniref:Elongation factor P--(R)-beta-lysine ligase n=1 Tax=BD1-7 clade bacterium TaxID=2029982 RepID=A0A5S9QGW3_9GAMM|nr:Elongation factor P--(R)-beta-lysine ligase [BD1-7 clade bacterium]
MQRWQPTASIEAIKARAQMYRLIRDFFSDRAVIEVDTPLVADCSVTDPHIDSLQLAQGNYLQTSPEYAIKRLLAAGVPDCFEITKAFRAEEQGRRHHTEFTLLEWYRIGFDLWDLMDEMADLIEQLLGCHHFEHKSYRTCFEEVLGFNPHTISDEQLIFEAKQLVDIEMRGASRDDWLHLLMSHAIEPELGQQAPVFVFDYPPSQAALARINRDESGEQVAARFELYYRGLELANGYHELADAAVQKQRFHQDNAERIKAGGQAMPVDYAFLDALESGLPDCSGVALGLDRVLMLALNTDRIDDVITFR